MTRKPKKVRERLEELEMQELMMEGDAMRMVILLKNGHTTEYICSIEQARNLVNEFMTWVKVFGIPICRKSKDIRIHTISATMVIPTSEIARITVEETL